MLSARGWIVFGSGIFLWIAARMVGSPSLHIAAVGVAILPLVVLGALAVPATQAGREDLNFSERAFWLFSTGHRLGDLRRLARQYGRPVESVYPTGLYVKGGLYGNAVSLPIPRDEQNNPKFVQCTNQSP